MTQNHWKWILPCAWCLLVMASPASAQKPGVATQPTEDRIQQLIRAAAERVGANVDRALPQSVATSQADAQPSVALSMDDAVRLALERNLDIAVQRLTPQTYDFSLAGIYATYKPTVSSLLSSQGATNPATTSIAGGLAGAGVDVTVDAFNAGIGQNIPKG